MASVVDGQGWSTFGSEVSCTIFYTLETANDLKTLKASAIDSPARDLVKDKDEAALKCLNELIDNGLHSESRDNLRKAYEILIKPFEDLLSKINSLVLKLSDERLWKLPFAALVDEEGEYLIVSYPIRFTPTLKPGQDASRPVPEKTKDWLKRHKLTGFMYENDFLEAKLVLLLIYFS